MRLNEVPVCVIANVTVTAASSRTWPIRAGFARRAGCAGLCAGGRSKPSNPRLIHRGPVMARPTSHRLAYCSINLVSTRLTRCGRARFARTLRCCPAGKDSDLWISRAARFLLSPVNEDDSISPSSSTFAPAGLSAGWWAEHLPRELVTQALEQATGSLPRHLQDHLSP